jgi:ribonuclease-3
VAGVAQRLFQNELGDVESHARLDYKSRLQERAQALWQSAPVYQVVAESGPDHDKRFEVALSFAGREWARASGRSKKEAEQSAAATALGALERQGEGEPEPEGGGR